MRDNKQIKILKIIIVAVSIFMAYAAIALLPELIDFSVENYSEIAFLAKPVAIIVFISSIPFFIVLFETILLCNYILTDDIFTIKPIKALNVVSISSLIIFLLFILITILFIVNSYFTPLLGVILLLVMLSSLIIAIFSKILYILVKKSTILKEDNDLTI